MPRALSLAHVIAQALRPRTRYGILTRVRVLLYENSIKRLALLHESAEQLIAEPLLSNKNDRTLVPLQIVFGDKIQVIPQPSVRDLCQRML